MSYEDDPWAVYERRAEAGLEKAEQRTKVADKFRKSLVDRSQRRVDAGTVDFRGNGYWVVAGNSRLGDAFPTYDVMFGGGKYKCECQNSDRIGAEIRRKGMCSHIIACMLHKEQNGYLIKSKAWDGRDVEARNEDRKLAAKKKKEAKKGTPLFSFNVIDASEGKEPWNEVAVDQVPADEYGDQSPPMTLTDQAIPSTFVQVDGGYVGSSQSWYASLGLSEGEVPTPSHPIFADSRHPLPQFLMEIVPGHDEWERWVRQWQTICEIMDQYWTGADVVVLDAPTGAGKTVIGEMVRRLRRKVFGDRYAAFVCNSLTLQDQFKRDFKYAKVLKGRSNYPTQLVPWPETTCADCTNDRGMADDAECEWCSEVRTCAYNVARQLALSDEIAIINTAYLLNEANYVGYTSGRDFVIADECDTLESILMGFVEFKISDKMLDELDIEVPKKGSHMSTITEWFEETLLPAFAGEIKRLPKSPKDVPTIRKKQRLERGKQAADLVCRQLMDSSTQADSGWVRDNDAGPMVLKPVKVDWSGEKYLWQHGKKWLCMSATVISVDEFGESLGLNISKVKIDSGPNADNVESSSFTNELPQTRSLDYRLVTHPMQFPVENRPIRIAPVANCTYKTMDEAKPKLAKAIGNILKLHPGERILVHTVSYALATYLQQYTPVDESRGRSCMLVYTESQEREAVIAKYLGMEGAVLFASSLTRGADFKYDACRVCVVAKVPYLSLGDRQISTRTRAKGGNLWYAVQTVRMLVQATGRGVRSMEDTCETYILDRQFVDNVYKRNKGLLPEWWREALDLGFYTGSLMQ